MSPGVAHAGALDDSVLVRSRMEGFGGFRVLGCRIFGFRVLGFRFLGFRI